MLEPNEGNREEILYDYIYARFKFYKPLPPMSQLSYAWTDSLSSNNNEQWWKEKKEQLRRFLILVYKLL